MAISLSDNLRISAPKPTDDRTGPWPSVTAALQADVLRSAYRVKGLTVVIEANGVSEEWWFRDGVADADLVRKGPGSGSTMGVGVWFGNVLPIGGPYGATKKILITKNGVDYWMPLMPTTNVPNPAGVVDIIGPFSATHKMRVSTDNGEYEIPLQRV